MSNISIAKENLYNSKINQDVKLILSNEFDILAGSIIFIKKNGEVFKYKNSGKPAIYSAHQELMLELFTETA